MALEFDEQLSRLQKPVREDMTDEEYIGFLNFKGSLYNDSCFLTDAQKEMIGVVVSSYNCCTYCLQTHGDNLRVDDHQILEAAFVAGFFNYTNRWVSTIAPVVNPGHFKHNRDFDK